MHADGDGNKYNKRTIDVVLTSQKKNIYIYIFK